MIPRVIHSVDSIRASVLEAASSERHQAWTNLPVAPAEGPPGGDGTALRLAERILEQLYRDGGFYLSHEVEVGRVLDPLRSYDLVAHTPDGTLLSGVFVAAVPEHAAIRASIDVLREMQTRWRASSDLEGLLGAIFSIAFEGRRDAVVLPPDAALDTRSRLLRSKSAEAHAPYLLIGQPRRRDLLAVTQKAWHDLVERTIDDLRESRFLRRTSAVYLGSNRTVIRLPNGLPLRAIADDQSLTPSLVTDGFYDLSFWRFIRRYVRPGDLVVDVGANIGLFTIEMAARVGRYGRVHAFEPSREVFGVLTENVGINWFAERTRLHNTALGGKDGHVTLMQDNQFRGSSVAGLLPDQPMSSTQHEGRFNSTDVPCRRMDSVLDATLPIRFVKIDVEGAEVDVLEGMEALIRSGAIQLIDVEVVRENAGSRWPELRNRLRSLVDDQNATTSIIRPNGKLSRVDLDQLLSSGGHFPHVIFDFTRQGNR